MLSILFVGQDINRSILLVERRNLKHQMHVSIIFYFIQPYTFTKVTSNAGNSIFNTRSANRRNLPFAASVEVKPSTSNQLVCTQVGEYGTRKDAATMIRFEIDCPHIPFNFFSTVVSIFFAPIPNDSMNSNAIPMSATSIIKTILTHAQVASCHFSTT